MTCPSQVTLSMYADDALEAKDAVLLERHAATCTTCRTRVAAFRRERCLVPPRFPGMAFRKLKMWISSVPRRTQPTTITCSPTFPRPISRTSP